MGCLASDRCGAVMAVGDPKVPGQLGFPQPKVPKKSMLCLKISETTEILAESDLEHPLLEDSYHDHYCIDYLVIPERVSPAS